MHETPLDSLLQRPFVFERLHQIAEAVRARGVSLFDLSLGCPAGRPPEHVLRAFTDSLRRFGTSAHRHSQVEGLPELRRAVSEWYERRFTVHLEPQEEILPMASPLEAIHLVLGADLEEAEVLLLPTPCPPSWLSAAALARAHPVFVPLDAEGRLAFDRIPPDSFRAARMLLLAYPQDPTGSVCDLGHLREALARCREHDILLVNDIRWSEFSLVEGHLPSSIFELPGAREGALEISTPACSHRLSGWGPAFLAGGAERIGRLALRAGHRGPGPFLAAQEATLSALTGDDAFLSQQRSRLRRQQQRFREGLARLGLSLPPSAATIYLWGPIPAGWGDDDQAFVEQVLDRSGVLLAPGSAFGPAGRGHVRLSLCLEDAALGACLGRLEETGAFVPA